MAKRNSKPEHRSAANKKRVNQYQCCQTRYAKIHSIGYCRTIKDQTHSAFDQTVFTPVPWLNLKGLWLQQAGFEIDTPITIKVMEKCIVVTTEE